MSPRTTGRGALPAHRRVPGPVGKGKRAGFIKDAEFRQLTAAAFPRDGTVRVVTMLVSRARQAMNSRTRYCRSAFPHPAGTRWRSHRPRRPPALAVSKLSLCSPPGSGRYAHIDKPGREAVALQSTIRTFSGAPSKQRGSPSMILLPSISTAPRTSVLLADRSAGIGIGGKAGHVAAVRIARQVRSPGRDRPF